MTAGRTITVPGTELVVNGIRKNTAVPGSAPDGRATKLRIPVAWLELDISDEDNDYQLCYVGSRDTRWDWATFNARERDAILVENGMYPEEYRLDAICQRWPEYQTDVAAVAESKAKSITRKRIPSAKAQPREFAWD